MCEDVETACYHESGPHHEVLLASFSLQRKSGMDVTFYGAVREVTGSMHLLTTSRDRVLLDCGLFQGHRKEAELKNRKIPVDPGVLTNVVLSHAHIDHSGRVPVLTKGDFSGRIICTRASADACRYLLLDCGHIQESDARYLNYKMVRSFLYNVKSGKEKRKITNRTVREIKKLLKKRGHEIDQAAIEAVIKRYQLQAVRPLYTQADAEDALDYFDGYPYNHEVAIGTDMTCTFYDAGHILGSSFCLIKAREKKERRTILYTGDVGRFDKPIIKDPTLEFAEEDRDIDLLVMESTYGNRHHGPVKELKARLAQVLVETVDRGGAVIIPSFAYGRTQELLYVLHELYNDGAVPRIPVYVDSPLAINLTRVFGEHPEVYDEDTHKTFLANGENPFAFSKIKFVSNLDESMALMKDKRPHVVIAGSGMCEAGRIVHHFRYKIHNPKNTILIVGYMAANTLGRRLLDRGLQYEASGREGPAPKLRFLNKEYPLEARVVELGGFSAHADQSELLAFVEKSNLRIKKIALVHGEEDQTLVLAKLLKKQGREVIVPQPGESIPVK